MRRCQRAEPRLAHARQRPAGGDRSHMLGAVGQRCPKDPERQLLLELGSTRWAYALGLRAARPSAALYCTAAVQMLFVHCDRLRLLGCRAGVQAANRWGSRHRQCCGRAAARAVRRPSCRCRWLSPSSPQHSPVFITSIYRPSCVLRRPSPVARRPRLCRCRKSLRVVTNQFVSNS